MWKYIRTREGGGGSRASISAFTTDASGAVETGAAAAAVSVPLLVPSAVAGGAPSDDWTAAGASEEMAATGLTSSLTVAGSTASGIDPQVQFNSGILRPTILKSVSVRLFSSRLPEEKLPDVVLTLSRLLVEALSPCRPPRFECEYPCPRPRNDWCDWDW